MLSLSIYKEKNTFIIYLTTAVLLLKDCFPTIFPTPVQVIILLGIIVNVKKNIDLKPIIWYGVFILYCFFELILNDYSRILVTLINTFLYIIAYNFTCKKKEDIYHFFKSFVLFGFVIFIYIFFKYHAILGYGRLGDNMDDTSYGNSIQFSYYLIVILCSCISYLILYAKKDFFVYFAVITLIMGFIIAAFNGAKKGILTPLLFIVMYIGFRYKRNIVKLLTYAAIFVIVVYLLWDTLKDVEILQRYFIERFSGFFAFLTGDNLYVDESTRQRASYIPIALNVFYDNPVWGLGGLAHSNDFFKSVIVVNHPHNLYLELLAAGGIMLFFIYFWFPFMLVFKYGRHLHNQNIHLLLFCFILTILFNDFNSSSYNIPIQNIIFVIAYRYLLLCDNRMKI